MTPEEIVQFILDPTLPENFLTLKLVFLIFSLLFIGFIIFALIKTDWLHQLMLWDWMEFLSYKHHGMAPVKKKWKKIMEKARKNEADARLAIIEADTLLEDILKRMGFKGQALVERLSVLTVDILDNLEEVKKANAIRQKLVDDPSYQLNLEAAQKVLDIYEKALENLQVL